jgi:predicted acetyltransferase
MAKFVFKKYPLFTDGEIDVVVEHEYPAKKEKGLQWTPTYYFKVMIHEQDEKIGRISLTIGYTDFLVLYNGQMGFSIKNEFQGHHYAAKACMLVKQVAIDHHMDTIWIGTDPGNFPSRRTCEIIGCSLVEVIDVPPDSFLYKEGHHQTCRYRWILYGDR